MYFSVVDGGDVLAALPTPLVEVRPQERMQRHCVEHLADLAPWVHFLDAPVPQMEDQFVDNLNLEDEVLDAVRRTDRKTFLHVPRFLSRRWWNS